MQIKKIFLFSFVSMLISSTCFSYGAIKVNRQGAPLKWTQFPITYNLDSGPAKGAAICNDPANP
ncbi:MAG: hypothetical protein JNK65_09190, partial [Deltaproteobacteria bacterium]|nr:hypothetical protein [Deltaproteobacteria bacterium]